MVNVESNDLGDRLGEQLGEQGLNLVRGGLTHPGDKKGRK